MPPQHPLSTPEAPSRAPTSPQQLSSGEAQNPGWKSKARRRQSRAEHPPVPSHPLSVPLGSHLRSSSAWGLHRHPGDLGAGAIMSVSACAAPTTPRTSPSAEMMHFCINAVAYQGRGKQTGKPHSTPDLHEAFWVTLPPA